MKTEIAVATLGALAQETRLSIFRALVRAHATKAGEGGLAAGAIGEAVGVAPATLSFHLKELAHAGLVAARREGRSVVYKANVAALQNLAEFLLKDCCRGSCGVLEIHSKRKDAAR